MAYFQLILIMRLVFTQILYESNFVSQTFSTTQGWSFWNSNSGYMTLDNGQAIFEGIDIFGIDTQIQKAFILPPHYMIRIEIIIWTFGLWSSDWIHLLCEDKIISSQQLYTMLNENYQSPLSLSIVTARNAATAVIQIRPGANQLKKQSWGIRDFSISYYPCKQDCVICSKTDASTCQQWKLNYQQFSSLSISSLTNEENFSYNECSGLPFFGYYSAGMLLKRVFFFEPHDRLRIQFLLIKLNNWESAILYLTVDGVIQQQIKDNLDSYHNFNYCDDEAGLDAMQRIDIDLSHSKQESIITIYSTLSDTQLFSSFGIRDLRIFINPTLSQPNSIAFNSEPIIYFATPTFVGTSGWQIQQLFDITRISLCGDKSIFGSFSSGESIRRTFPLTPHSKVKLTMTVYCIDTWDDETLFIYIDGVLIYTNTKAPDEGQANLCGYGEPYKEKIVYFSREFAHTKNEITIKIDSNLDTPVEESFGMRDFRLQLADCPFDCSACNSIQGDECQFKYRDEYWHFKEQIIEDGEGWGNRYYQDASIEVTECDGLSLLGGYGSVKNLSFMNLILFIENHIRIRILFQLYIIGNWDNDYVVITIDSLQFYSKQLTSLNTNIVCQAGLPAYVIQFDEIILHTSNTFEIKITNNIPLFPTNNKSFGVREFYLYQPPN